MNTPPPRAALFRDAIVFIYQNIDQPLTLDEIADASDTSVSTLKRAFEEELGTTPGAMIRRLKMELAFRSIQSKNASILEVALASGFEDHAAFSRSFKRAFGYPPSSARSRMTLQRDLEHIALEEPDLVDLEAFTVQATTAQGYYFECAPRAWERLGEAMKSVPEGETEACLYIGMALDDPHTGRVADSDVRFVGGVHGIRRDLGLEVVAIPAGRYARFRFEGRSSNLGLAYHYIYGAWREQASLRILEQPAFLMFEELPAVPRTSGRILVCVPIEQTI